jgi:hypothetical protein
VIGPDTLTIEDGYWIWPFDELEVWADVASQLLGKQATFDAKLSERWGRLIACTPMFSSLWSGVPGYPSVHKVTRYI